MKALITIAAALLLAGCTGTATTNPFPLLALVTVAMAAMYWDKTKTRGEQT